MLGQARQAGKEGKGEEGWKSKWRMGTEGEGVDEDDKKGGGGRSSKRAGTERGRDADKRRKAKMPSWPDSTMKTVRRTKTETALETRKT